MTYRMQLVQIARDCKAYYTKLQEKLLVNNVHEKNIAESQDRRNFESVRAICNLHSCYNFALVLHENAPVFSQSEASNFFHVHY